MSNIEIIVGRSRSRSLLGVTQLFVSGLYLKNYLINTNVVCYACSLHLGRVSRIKLQIVQGHFSSPVVFLCDTPGVVRRPSYVVCVVSSNLTTADIKEII